MYLKERKRLELLYEIIISRLLGKNQLIIS